MMKEIIIRRFVFLFVAFTVVFSSALVFAKSKQEPPPNAKARVGTLYLFQKSAADGPWPVVHDGAWGDMKYNLWGDKFNFIFKGRQLNPGTAYTLIYYPDPWPGTNLICLGAGVANRGGNLISLTLGLTSGPVCLQSTMQTIPLFPPRGQWVQRSGLFVPVT